MDYMDKLENESIYIIREAYNRFRKVAMLWSMGKDSTSLLYICRKAFFDEIPFPVIHIDTGFKFEEIYNFRAEYAKKWHLNLIISRNEEALKDGISPRNGRFECCMRLKTEALKSTIREYGFKALLLAIRRDEHGIRAKERFFSLRDTDFRWNYTNQPLEVWSQYKSKLSEGEHFRIHPMLQWTEKDVWEYIQREKIPVVNLYFAKDKKRYRSIGCHPYCEPVDSEANTISKIIRELKTSQVAERSGRTQDKEKAYIMQKLRSLGYM